MESELDMAIRLAVLMLPQAQANALAAAVKAETDNFNAVLERAWASQRDLASSRDAALAEVARLTRALKEARAEVETYKRCWQSEGEARNKIEARCLAAEAEVSRLRGQVEGAWRAGVEAAARYTLDHLPASVPNWKAMNLFDALRALPPPSAPADDTDTNHKEKP